MIRYADRSDFGILFTYEHCINEDDLLNSIESKRILVMFLENDFLGWLRYNLFWDNIPFLNMLYLIHNYRNKGYGTQLLTYWEKQMLSMGYDRVLTSTLSNELAQFFYRKNGYIDCGSLLLPNEPLEIILLKDIRRK